MTASGLDEKNRRFYDTLWSKTYLTSPKRFNTWPLVSSLTASAPKRLEVGAGMRPRLPIAGTHFIDASPPAVERLNARGGIAQCGQITELRGGGSRCVGRAFDDAEPRAMQSRAKPRARFDAGVVLRRANRINNNSMRIGDGNPVELRVRRR